MSRTLLPIPPVKLTESGRIEAAEASQSTFLSSLSRRVLPNFRLEKDVRLARLRSHAFASQPLTLDVNEMSQAQNIVDIQMLDGSTSRAIATGNNAAWICICRRSEPLLGRTGSLKGVSAATRIDCPACGRKYFVVPKGKDQGPVAKVLEVK